MLGQPSQLVTVDQLAALVAAKSAFIASTRTIMYGLPLCHSHFPLIPLCHAKGPPNAVTQLCIRSLSCSLLQLHIQMQPQCQVTNLAMATTSVLSRLHKRNATQLHQPCSRHDPQQCATLHHWHKVLLVAFIATRCK